MEFKNITAAREHLLGEYAKLIKKDLPKACTFLSVAKKPGNKLYFKAIVNKQSYLYSLPENLELTNADLERVKKLILEKCQQEN